MIIPQTNIIITQRPTDDYPLRNKTFTLNFITEGQIESTWEHLTDTAKLTFPKKVYVGDEDGNKTTWADKDIIAGKDSPIITRGDQVEVQLGYIYPSTKNKGEFETAITGQNGILPTFKGYVASVKNKVPIEITCEDNMFMLKKNTVINKVDPTKDSTSDSNLFESSYTYKGRTGLEAMLLNMIEQVNFKQGTNFTIGMANIKSDIGDYRVINVTLAEVLDELRKTYHLESFFRGDELRCGLIRYYPEDRKTIPDIFHFQKNIIYPYDDLDYQRDVDIKIKLKAYSINEIELLTGTTDKDGTKKTKHERLTADVGDSDGEVRTLYFWNVKTVAELETLAKTKIKFLKYTGFRGKFLTFGMPFIQHGNTVKLQNDIIKELSGEYLVKAVNTKFGFKVGIRQEIVLDLRVDTLTNDEISQYNSNGL
jgi:hypothetical protein